MPGAKFIAHFGSHSLVEDFVRYLIERVDEQQSALSVAL
jgi:hypothetical protein